MKKLLFLLMIMLLPMVAIADDNGSCGDGVTFVYEETTHILTISKTGEGTGRMSNYSYDSRNYAPSPWYSYCENIFKIVIEDGVLSIGDAAFIDCSNLMFITIGNSVVNIGSFAFAGCNSLTSVAIPNNVNSISDYAFRYCKSLIYVTIGDNVKTIGDFTFELCTSLTSINIPSSVTTIGKSAFYGCRALTSITIPNFVTNIDIDTFYGCSGLTSITIGSSVTSIGSNAFWGCSGLTNVIIPDAVINIGSAAFCDCSCLTTVTIGNSVTTIGNGAFAGCNSLVSINIPNSVTAICEFTFYNCSSLKDITIPNSLISIGQYAFAGCRGLTSIAIPNTVTSIGCYAFYGCSSLTDATIPSNLLLLDEGLYKGCSNMKSVILPSNLKIIRQQAFSDCSRLLNLTIPPSVEFIYQEAFANCSSLEKIKALPPTPPFLYDNSFSNYSVPLKVPKGLKNVYQTAQGWKNFTNISDADKYKLTYVVDNEEYKSYEIEEGTTITPEAEPMKEGYAFSGWSEIPETMPAHDVTVTGSFSINTYKLTYIVDAEEYKSLELEYGATITPEAAPTKEGYTFSGWSEIPETMPAHDVTVTGLFSINSYKLTYIVDGEEYKSSEIEYGATITPETEPIKEGYTFSGWSEIPETMPAKDVTVTGTFTINKYKLTYMVDSEEYKSYDIEYGASITPEVSPTKEGYSFSGWSDIPETMPAKDVTVTGLFAINKYKLTYIVDGEDYKTYEIEYGATITPEVAPTKEGYTFSGWSETPETMPANDVTVTGSFTINSYKLTYMIDDKVYKEIMYEYGATITPELQPEGDYATFEWTGLPQTMPAHDVVVYANYISGIIEVLMTRQGNIRIYSPNGKKQDKLQKGLNIMVLDDGTVKKVVVK